MPTLLDTFEKVREIAAKESCVSQNDITYETRLDRVFTDSLEYLEFLQALAVLGEISNEVVARAETFGDLANALVPAN
jgi:hypothetical protein